MTVNTTNRKTSFTGNGTTGPYTYDFKIQQASDLEVYLAGVKQLSGWTATPNANLVGGSINFSSTVTSGVAGLIARALDQIQETSIPAEANMPETTLESMHDKSMMVAQELQEQVDRSFKLPITTSVDAEFGDPSTDGQVLAYNETDDQLEWTSVAALYSSGGVGTGNVTGPSSSTDSNLAAFDGTTGRLLKDSGITVPATTGKALFPVRVNSGATGLEYFDQTPSQLTVDNADEDITPTKNIHTIGTYGGAGTDDLTDIDATNVPVGHELTLKSDGSGNVVTVKTTGNIDTYDGNDFAIEDGYYLKLYWDGTNWKEIGRLSSSTGEQANDSEFTPTFGLLRTWAHGLSVAPNLVWARFRCKSAELGYSVNDYVYHYLQYSYTYGWATELYANATNAYFDSDATYGIGLPTKSTAIPTAITASKWRCQLFARL